MKNKGILFYEFTNAGLVRDINQDSILARNAGRYGVFFVADGMGGYSHGEIASSELVTAMDKVWDEFISKEKLSFPELVKVISDELIRVSRTIYEKYNQKEVCGTTVVGLLVYENYYATFSVGDSRIYSCKGNGLSQISFDDIWDNQPEVIEKYSRQEIVSHKNHGLLISAIGTEANVSIRTNTGELAHKQIFVLCSDGLYKFCEESYIKKSLHQGLFKKELQDIGNSLFERVKSNGAKDNVSFIIVAPQI